MLMLISLCFPVMFVDIIFWEPGFFYTAMLGRAAILFWSLDWAIVHLNLEDYLSFRTVILLFLVGLKLIEAAPCPTCGGAVEGCDGTSCPWLDGVAQNARAVAAATMVVTSVLTLKTLLPDGLLQAFPRQALDTLLTLSKMPSRGVPIDLSSGSLDIPTLKLYWSAGRVSRAEVSRGVDIITEHVYNLAGDDGKAAQAKLAMSLKSLEIAMKDEPSSADVEGGYRHYIMSRISHFVLRVDASSAIRSATDRASTASLSGSNLVGIFMFPPREVADLVIPQMVHYYCLFVHALGFENILGLGLFVNRVVYDTVLKLGYTWMFALELLLVYLKALDGSNVLNMTTIWEGGSQDTYLNKAKSEFRLRWGDKAMFFRTHGGNPLDTSRGGGDDDTPFNGWGKRKPFNGRSSQDPKARPCVCHNLHKDHPSKSLLADGTCKYAHVCDQYVTDQGPGGRCRSAKHTRDKCDNPNKGAKQE